MVRVPAGFAAASRRASLRQGYMSTGTPTRVSRARTASLLATGLASPLLCVIVRSAALAVHASSGGARLHTDQRRHGGFSALTRDGVHGLLCVERAGGRRGFSGALDSK